VDYLNKNVFAGFNDWRLPTLEEAMSLVEREKKNENLNIAPVFDRKQWCIWTCDENNYDIKWSIYFDLNRIYYSNSYQCYVRAVRTN